MPTFAMVAGKIDGEIKRNTVGDEKLPVANFRVETDPGKGWYSVAAWRDMAAKVPAPGSYVIVTGKLSTRTYDKDGQKHVAVEVVASTIETIGAAAPAEDMFAD